MRRGAVRLVFAAAAFALGTYAFGWWAVAAIAVGWGAMLGGGWLAALRAACAAAIAWAVLLAVPAAAGAPIVPWAHTLADVMQTRARVLLGIELAFPFALAWGGAMLGAAARGRSAALPPAPPR